MISVSRLPHEDQNENHAAVLKTRISTAWQHYIEKSGVTTTTLYVSTTPNDDNRVDSDSAQKSAGNGKTAGVSVDERASQYKSQRPLYDMSRLIVPEETRQHLLLASQVVALERQVFDEWGIRSIEPFPRSALNFHGAPGTGKSLAAHAIASHLNCNILLASYAQIESMYHGEGPKNVEAVFRAAERENALLFIDEADSLLSKRLTNVTQGSEQAINSMRSQLLICMERFRGVVVFATNLVENYDKAFETRVRSIEFILPDRECRRRIWDAHIPAQLPVHRDVNFDKLAEIEGLCGREIRNAVVDAAMQAAAHSQSCVTQKDFLDAADRVMKSRFSKDEDVTVHDLTPNEQEAVEKALRK